MRKNFKYIVVTGLIIVGGSFIQNNLAKATMRGRNFFSRLFSSCTGGNLRRTVSNPYISSAPSQDNTSKTLNIKDNLSERANKLLEANLKSGVNIKDFDKSGVVGISDDKYYHQYKKRGETITLISNAKPQVQGIGDNGVVLSTYSDPTDGSVNLLTVGLPIWEKGEDINRVNN